ncbi:hypothetical protein IMSAG249_00180 [Lachnospiraceae bacterium]|nr:hypothetical protein IMSAGC009_03174 [Lachnospiraceae bacterium]GFI68364.1 hypothetical protein IMSAG249_00180 [Lachnospiraceae bacterium]
MYLLLQVLRNRGDKVQDETTQATSTQEVKAKRTAKNSVFLDLFQDKKNLLKLYKTLHSEDTTATEDTLDIVTIDNVLTDNLYNDLGIMVGNNRLLLLLEAQSSWTVNILIRILLYLAQSYHEYFEKTSQSLYKSTKVKMPKPELYIIYTGNKGRRPDTISLSQEFFDGADIDIEVKAKVIYEKDTEDIINQYIIFCKVFDEQRKLYGMTEQTVKETIRICKDRNILKEYLISREKEVVTIMMSLFDDEQIMRTYLKDAANTAAYEADRATAERMIKKGKMSLEDIADCVPSLSLEELKELEAEVMQLA